MSVVAQPVRCATLLICLALINALWLCDAAEGVSHQIRRLQQGFAPFEQLAEQEGQLQLNEQTASTLENRECSICDPFNCPALAKCSAGVVRDRCGCCEECAIEEGHLCNADQFRPEKDVWYGHCGVNLECRERTDVDQQLVGRQSICYCVKPGLSCASDGLTYSACRMREIEVSSNNATHMISHGPCKTPPRIISIADSEIVPTNSRVSYLCEVEGYPMPTIIWYHFKPGSTTPIRLPGDSDHISVSFRGGPQPMRISSHLQITQFHTENEGKYRCFADNDMGMTMREFSLVAGPENYAQPDAP